MNDSIFQPNYTITPTIEFRLANIERNSWLIENLLLMPKHEAWLSREVRVGRAVGTTRIEGAELDEQAVARLESQSVNRSGNSDEQDNINALQAYDFIDYLSDQRDIPVDELVIRQLNRHFIATAIPLLTPGAYRKGANAVGEYQPPDQGDVPEVMRSFALWLRNDEDEINPLLKAGIAHLHLVAIHPFWDGNGRTARGLETLMLQRTEFGFKKLLNTEIGLFNIKDDYFEAIRRSLGKVFSRDHDFTEWLEFITAILEGESSILVKNITDWHRMMEDVRKSGEEVGLIPRQVDGYAFAVRTGQIIRGQYLEITSVSPVTASRDLADLVQKGLLTTEGKTRSRVYRPVSLEDFRKIATQAGQLPLLERREMIIIWQCQ